MIRNDRQLSIARRKLDKLREAASRATGEDVQVWETLAQEVACDIDEFLAIRSGSVKAFEVNSLDALPGSFIKARIAQGITQAELASRLGVSEQMVQKDEAGGYESAGIDRIADVCDALGYELVGRLQPAGNTRIYVSIASEAPTSPPQPVQFHSETTTMFVSNVAPVPIANHPMHFYRGLPS
ncbi:helix-turn-helix domain-containing protein [Streptomyces sp. NPDC091280]|uniref:helix-turn-helix domain-containing protein n=1 Tax=Streptomyces sp. NPDC091280 TaxID=3365984 RepID=UPI00381CB101